MKKLLTIFLIIAVIAVILSGCNAEAAFGEELVLNGGFEDGMDEWERKNGQDAYFAIKNIQPGSDQHQNREEYGLKYIELDTGPGADNWMYLTQRISVVKGATYKLEVSINMTSDIDSSVPYSGRIGAYAGFLQEVGNKKLNITKKTDGWQVYTFYFTPANSKYLDLQIGMGSPSSPIMGMASFDNISVKRVESVPEGKELFTIGTPGRIDNSTPAGNAYVISLSIISALLLYCSYVLIRRLLSKSKAFTEPSDGGNKGGFFKSPYFILGSIIVVAFAIRFLIVNFVYGFAGDVSMFREWAMRLVEDGPWRFYSNVETTYPPGYLYILWGLGALANVLGISSGSIGMSIFLKIPAIICDIIIVYLIFNLALKHFNTVISAIVAGLYAVLPVIFTASAAWGQMHSVYGLFILLTFIAVLDKKYISVIIYYTIAVMLRAESLILLPIITVYLAYVFKSNPIIRTKLLIASGMSLVSVIALSLPFTVLLGGASPIFYIFTRFALTSIINPFFSVNAFNFYAIFGLNMQGVSSFAIVVSFVIYILASIYVCYIYFYKKNRAELLLLASFLICVVSVFSSSMTPLSMNIAFALMLAYIAISREKRIFLIFSILAVVNFFNIAQLLNQSGYISIVGINAQLVSFASNDAFIIIGSIINVLTVLYFATVIFDICYSDDVREWEPMRKPYLVVVKDFCKGVKDLIVIKKK